MPIFRFSIYRFNVQLIDEIDCGISIYPILFQFTAGADTVRFQFTADSDTGFTTDIVRFQFTYTGTEFTADTVRFQFTAGAERFQFPACHGTVHVIRFNLPMTL